MDEKRCVVCENYFYSHAMEGDKCKQCATLYPNAKTKDDIKMDNKPKAKTLSDETVKEIVYDVLEEAGIKRFKCENCNKLFFKNSPAQKYCSNCKEKEKK
jgi:hypothetical protein